MRIGVVGCGYWGSRHLRVLHQIGDVDQVVAIDQRPEAIPLAQSAFPDIRAFDGLTDALPNVDALIIATPPSTHHALALPPCERASTCWLRSRWPRVRLLQKR